ncbi:MAG: GTP-binding protein, partial [Deltaproteobacteria bacterium]
EEFVYKGIAVRLIDTAGIRKTENVVENIGIDKALEKIRTADLILLVLDVSEDFSEEDRMLIDIVASKKKILVLNKIDLGEKWKPEKNLIEKVFIKGDLIPVVQHVSALSRSGIEKLLDAIYEELLGTQANSDTVFLTKSRHKLSLEKALKYLDAYQEGLADRRPLEFMALELREAVNELEVIIGKITTDDIYDKLFSSFCIGK